MGRRSAFANGLLAVLLVLPATLPYLNHFLVPHGDRAWPTGLVFLDAPYYLANLREHFDTGTFRWLYANGHDWTYDTEHIYFQPWALLVAVGWQISGLSDPLAAWVVFWAASALVCCAVIIALFTRVNGLRRLRDHVLLVAFAWGGGLFALAGATVSLLDAGNLDGTLRFDPVGGWWALNLGRNLVYPHEAFLHALFLGALLTALNGRRGTTVLLALVLSFSHPWTGIQLPLVLLAWVGVEWLASRRSAWLGFGAAVAGVAAVHILYYKVFLGFFPRHRVVESQMSTMHWVYGIDTQLLAFGVVGAAALWCVRSRDAARAHLIRSANRLFASLALVTLALTNHDLVVSNPIQPLHFDRGYVYTGLFLFGLPAFHAAADAIGRLRPVVATLLASLAMGVVLSDNVAFFGAYLVKPADRARYGFKLTDDERAVMRALDDPELRGATVICSSPEFEFLVPVMTPLRAWASLNHAIPDNAQRQAELTRFWSAGAMPTEWSNRRLIFVFERGAASEAARAAIAATGATRRGAWPSYEMWYR
ncbi:MAG: hypothetical protein AB1635_12770 [Acidobacteriota bacterium]